MSELEGEIDLDGSRIAGQLFEYKRVEVEVGPRSERSEDVQLPIGVTCEPLADLRSILSVF